MMEELVPVTSAYYRKNVVEKRLDGKALAADIQNDIGSVDFGSLDIGLDAGKYANRGIG